MMNSVLSKCSKRHQCVLCQKTYPVSASLKRHMRTHTGERPYECSICHMAFAQITTLKSHMLRHTGERPFECKVCHQSFAQSSALYRHERLHFEKVPNESLDRRFKVKRYYCKWCDRIYKPSFFKYHRCLPNQVQHRAPVPHKCSVCGQKPIDNIKLHMLIHYEYKPYQCSICQLGFSTVSNWKEHMMKEQCKNRPRTT